MAAKRQREGRDAMRIHATLFCQHCARPTLHVFAERQVEPVRPGRQTFVRLLYECDRCGTMRVWGSEPRVPNRDEAAREADVFDHAVREHGMRRANCPVCRAIGVDCDECEGRGWVWGFDRVGPCGAKCLLGAEGDPTRSLAEKSDPQKPSGDTGDAWDDGGEAAENTDEADDEFAEVWGTGRGRRGRKGTPS